MDLSLQAKLLRVIQEKELTRVGGNEIIKLDVRIIVATHRDLTEESRKGNFREDLYYRLLGLPITLPPLRDRGHDVIIIGKYMLQQFCEENQMPSRFFSREAQEKLLSYNWPGNVRELKSVVELAAVMSNSEEIAEKDVKFNAPIRTELLQGEELTLKEHTITIIQRMLEKYDNNVLKVAAKLDIGKSTIYRYLKEMESSAVFKDE
jgi:DNA-binding NtrC family response regulator